MTERSRNFYAQQSMMLQVDAAGSVIGELGAAHLRLAYTAYGQLPELMRIGLLGFNGQLLERDSQGYLLGNGHRLYDPQLMRFVCPDALSPFGEGGLNAYVYCGGDPVNNVDPSGQALISGVLKWLGLRKKTGLTKEAGAVGLTKLQVKPYYREVGAPGKIKPGMNEIARADEFLIGNEKYEITRSPHKVYLNKAEHSATSEEVGSYVESFAPSRQEAEPSASPTEDEQRSYVLMGPGSASVNQARDRVRS